MKGKNTTKMSRQKFECGKWKMFQNDVLNNILKPSLSPLVAFFNGCFTTLNEFEDQFFENISLNMHFWGKSFKRKFFHVKFLSD